MITEAQKKEILESDDYVAYCQEFIECSSCPLNKEKDCSAEFYKIKLEAEKAKTKKLKDCVEFYADKNNWLFSGMYCSTGGHRIVDRMQALSGWHDEHKSILEIDVEKHNEFLYFGGKLARQTIKELEAMDGK